MKTYTVTVFFEKGSKKQKKVIEVSVENPKTIFSEAEKIMVSAPFNATTILSMSL